MKKLFSCLSAISVCVSLSAQQRSLEDIFSIAQRHLETRGVTATRGVDHIELIPASKLLALTSPIETENFYLCNTPTDGFVLVSANAEMPEILGYSSKSYDAENPLPTGLLSLLQDYAKLDPLALKTSIPPSALKEVDPMIKTAWDQIEPFNGMCPRDGTRRSLTGCIATAAAQLMRYYEWPEKKGTGKIDYITESRKIPVKINLEDYNFAWSKMLDKYEKDKYSTTQSSAVSRLMYAVGAACRMDYAWNESGATMSDFMKGMDEYFGYDKDMIMVLGDYVPAETWNELIVNELNLAHPVMFSGRTEDMNTGHSFLLDGYRQEGGNIRYHVNWGWGGEGDGYYLIYKMEAAKDGVSMGAGAYNTSQMIVVNCKPDDGVTNPMYATIDKVEVSRTYFESGAPLAFSLKYDDILCLMGEDFTGAVYAEVLDEQQNVKVQRELCQTTYLLWNFNSLEADQNFPTMRDGLYTLRPYLVDARGRRIDFISPNPWPVLQVGGTQGIAEVCNQLQETVYDLQGFKKKSAGNHQLPAGFYIVNGKKVVVK